MPRLSGPAPLPLDEVEEFAEPLPAHSGSLDDSAGELDALGPPPPARTGTRPSQVGLARAGGATSSRRRSQPTGRTSSMRRLRPNRQRQQILVAGIGAGAFVLVATVAGILALSGGAAPTPAGPDSPKKDVPGKQEERKDVVAEYEDRLRALASPVEKLARLEEWLEEVGGEDRDRLAAIRDRIVDEVAAENERRLEKILVAAQGAYERGRLESGDAEIARFEPVHDPEGAWRERARLEGRRMRRTAEWTARKAEIDRAFEEGRLEDAEQAIESLGPLAEAPGAPVAIQAWRRRQKAGEADVARARLDESLAAAIRGGTEVGRRRLEEARRALAIQREARRTIDAQLALGMIDSTRRRAIDLALSRTFTIKEARIVGFDGEKIKVSWPSGEVDVVLERLSDVQYEKILMLGLKGAGGREHLWVGKQFLRRRLFRPAEECFEAARKADPTLEPILPDLARIRAAERIFRGRYDVLGTTLSLTWDLDDEKEVEDFECEEGELVVEGGALVVRGEYMAMARARSIPFRDHVRAAVAPGRATRAAHLLGLSFVRPDGTPVQILGFVIRQAKAFAAMRIVGEEQEELIEPRVFEAGSELEMEFDRGRFIFRIGKEKLYEGWEGGFTNVALVLGTMATARGGAEAAFDSVRVEGRVDPLWIRKKTDEYRDVLAAELAREHRIEDESEEPGAAEMDLSIDPALPKLDPELAGEFESVRSAVRDFHRSRDLETFLAAQRSADAFAALNPDFAPAQYLKAHMKEQVGEYHEALACYGQALAALPDFPEALVARARLEAVLGRREEAEALVRRAIEVKADLAPAHVVLSQLAFRKGDAATSLEEAGLAEALAPTDRVVRNEARMMANVARGPQWEKSNVAQTDHYRVASDLARDKVADYARRLEALRPYYAQMLGRTAPAAGRSSVLIFDTEEGYHLYGEFSAGDRYENTLGLYSPEIGQLMLYEDADLAGTLETLYHEGFHQYLHALGWGIPIWYNEGMAEYVAGVEVKDGKVVKSGLLQKGRLLNLKAALQYGWRPVPFERIMNESQIEFYSQDPSLRYAQAWSMIHFFVHAHGGKYKKTLDDYVARLLDGATGEEAFQATFGKEDLSRVEREWRTYFDGLKP